MNKPEHIGTFDGGKYLVRAWTVVSPFSAFVIFPKHYSITIEEKGSQPKWEIRSNKYNHQSVQEMANAIAHLLSFSNLSGEHYSPEWCQEYFS